ncbi:hypothetical protein BGX33_007589 [Mortierella sp. NVP41]|nr:hypothetical protein BGX33_007589 [Mortierella sp. NVP41]
MASMPTNTMTLLTRFSSLQGSQRSASFWILSGVFSHRALALEKRELSIEPVTIISSLQLLKYRGDPFSNLGEGFNWSQRSQGGYGYGNGSAYQTLAEGMEDERDAEEISIPRHHHHQHGRHRGSHQSSSFMTNSSRSASVKSSRAGSGHNVELGHHGNGYDSSASGGERGGGGGGNAVHVPISSAPGPPGPPGTPGSGSGGGGGAAAAAVRDKDKDERRNKVGMNFSEDEDEDVGSGHDGTPNSGPPGNSRAEYLPF